MRRLRGGVGRSWLLGVAVSVWSVSGILAAGQEQDREARVDQIFAAWDTAETPGCAVSVMREGELVHARGYGVANLEYDIPITASSIFHVASISKQFTALAVALLVADGEVSWDDDLRTYVPEVPDLGPRITLRHLVHHTSGIRDQWSLLRMAGWRFEADVVTQDDVLDLISRQRALNFEPGTDYVYSNSGFTLLAVVVERVSGQTLREFAAARIFGPLGMTSTHFHDDHQMIVRNRAYAYAPDDAGTLRISIPDFDTVGATSLFTTVEDLARWDRNFFTAEVGGRDVLEQLHERGSLAGGRTISYAFGLAHGTHRGYPTVGHGGSDAGYRSQFVRFPDERLSVAVLCNFPTSDPGSLALRVADVYLPADAEASGADNGGGRQDSGDTGDGGSTDAGAAASAEALNALAGYYRREDTDVPLHLVARGDRLTTVGSGPRRTLLPIDGRRFRITGSSEPATFDPGNGEQPTTLRLGGVTETVYTQAPPRRAEDELASYDGTYYSDDLAVQYAFRIEGGRLILWHRKLGRVPLTPTFADGFYTDGFYLTFTRDAENQVDGFTMSSGRAWKVRFDKHDQGP